MALTFPNPLWYVNRATQLLSILQKAATVVALGLKIDRLQARWIFMDVIVREHY